LSGQLSILIPELVVGGAQRSMLKLSGGIAARGYEVDLVLARAMGPLLAEVPPSVRLVDLGARRTVTSLPALVRYLRNERPAALLSVLHANMVALWAGRLVGDGLRTIVSERNTLSREAEHYRSSVRMQLMPKLAKLFYPWADEIVAVSEGVADDLSGMTGLPRERIRVIYNPIVTAELADMARAPLDHPWFAAGQPPVVLAVGRLEAQKDFTTLIRSFALVRRHRPSRLLILGEGEERPALEALVEDLSLQSDVGLPGFVPNPCPYMAHAALFVLSSKWEGLPGVLIEAMYCGAPVVSTDCPSGPREILADGQYGELVPVGDIDVMARAIEERLALDKSPPPKESWRRFERETVVSEYIRVLFGQ